MSKQRIDPRRTCTECGGQRQTTSMAASDRLCSGCRAKAALKARPVIAAVTENTPEVPAGPPEMAKVLTKVNEELAARHGWVDPNSNDLHVPAEVFTKEPVDVTLEGPVAVEILHSIDQAKP